jgi:hypothetical protein
MSADEVLETRQFMYHVSPTANRESIQRLGLKARAPQQRLIWRRKEGYQGRAVYLAEDPRTFLDTR